MDPEFSLKLYQTHVQMTKTNPITYHEFTPPPIELTSVKKEELQKIVQQVFDLYKQTPEGKLYGSVDINPSFWASVYVSTMITAQKKNTSGFVPNGCCDMSNCGIKQFYGILHDILYNYYREGIKSWKFKKQKLKRNVRRK